MIQQGNNINKTNASRGERLPQWTKIRDALEGEDRVKARGETYLPKPNGMKLPAYRAYLMRSCFYAVADRTLMGLTGLIFRHEPVFKLPKRLEPLLTYATPTYQSLTMLAHDIAREQLSVGRLGLLLDYPEFVPSPTTPPRIGMYRAEDIYDWMFGLHPATGEFCLKRVVFRQDYDTASSNDPETLMEYLLDDGGNVVANRWKINLPSKTWAIVKSYTPEVNGRRLQKIPFWFVNSRNMDPSIIKSPMLDFVNVNLAHYRNSADYEHALFLTAQPTPWAAGAWTETNKPTTIGPAVIWHLPEGGEAGMLEFTGAGVQAQQLAMKDKEERMAALGAALILDKSNVAETAETTRLKSKADTSLLVSSALTLEAALEAVLREASIWVGQEIPESDKEKAVTITKDFVETRMAPGELQQLVAAWMAGAISRDTMHTNLQRGEIIAPTRTVEEERELVEEEMPEPEPLPDDTQTTEDPDDEEDDEDADPDEKDPKKDDVPPGKKPAAKKAPAKKKPK